MLFNGYLLGIQEVLERQCTALMIVIPKELEEKYINRISKSRKINASFKLRKTFEGEQEKREGKKIGKDIVMSRRIETKA